MQVNVEYSAQLKRAAGVASETIELDDGATLHDLVARIAEQHDDALKPILVAEDGTPHPSILTFLNDSQVRGQEDAALTDGCTVSFLSPISGG